MSLPRRVNKRLRRIIFVAGHIAAIAVLAVCIVLPMDDFFKDRSDHIAMQRMLLARLQAVAAQDASVRAIAHQVEAQQGEFLVGSDEGLVNANLQTRLKGLSESAGARVRSAQSLPPKATEGIRYSGSRIEIYGTLQSIQRAIYAIETAKPYLFVMGAALRPALSASKPGVPEEPVIQAQLDIFAPMRIEGRDP